MRVAFKEFYEIMGLIDSSYHEAAVKMNLSDSELDILYILQAHPEGCNQSVIYKEAGLTKSTANTALKKMESNGDIRITPGKGRNTWVSVTEKGRERIENTVCRIIEIENNIYDSWTEKERDIFMQLNRDFVKKFHEEVERL